MARHADLQARIIANTILSDEVMFEGSPCWVWIGTRNLAGYGRISLRIKGKHVKRYAHRIALTVFRGIRLRVDNVVMHLCNNPMCCNPEHLKRGTQSQNVRHAVKCGRHKSNFVRRGTGG